ncbi:unnamed protein product [Blepharisma stoltei]|uniref:Signal recognition particle receptor subunit beta n=1 Tax=Blepharisma stoltei TaxID=1481888 RepID=A0AAU9J2K4_9CILI|nr:unnamed protein product [Blepharisma stoltei]
MDSLYLILIIIPIILILYFKFFSKSSSPKHPEIVISGPSGSGKTMLYYKLTENRSPTTVSSLKINQGTATIGSKLATITDIPGHNYFQKNLLSKLPRSKGLIMLIDSTDKPSFKKAAEDLFEIFSTHNPKQVLIFCNKQDQPLAKKTLMIESELSTEIERLRKIKVSDLTDTLRKPIGKEGERFDFCHMEENGVLVEIFEGSVETNDFEPITRFIEKVI